MLMLNDFQNLGKRGRPKGSKKEKKNSEEVELTLGWVGKHKQWKTKKEWETDEEFKGVFLKKGLPVRRCTNLSGGSLQRVYDHDLEYVKIN